MQMTKEEFWEITASFQHAKIDKQLAAMRAVLGKFSRQKLEWFFAHWKTEFWRLYHWDVSAVAHIIFGGCGDDLFCDFRTWLVFKGEEACRNIFESPKLLIPTLRESTGVASERWNVISCDLAWDRFEDFSTPEIDGAIKRPDNTGDLAGEKYDKEKLAERFPEVWSEFYNNWL